MKDIIEPDQELERLESMHERVEKLRSKLKHIEKTSYSIIGSEQEPAADSPAAPDKESKNYT